MKKSTYYRNVSVGRFYFTAVIKEIYSRRERKDFYIQVGHFRTPPQTFFEAIMQYIALNYFSDGYWSTSENISLDDKIHELALAATKAFPRR